MDTIDLTPPTERFCDGCGLKIPSTAKLASLQRSEGGRDLCLSCQIRDAQITKGLKH